MITITSNEKAFIAALSQISKIVSNAANKVPSGVVERNKTMLTFDNVNTMSYAAHGEGSISLTGENLTERFENGELPDIEKQLQMIQAQIVADVRQTIKDGLK